MTDINGILSNLIVQTEIRISELWDKHRKAIKITEQENIKADIEISKKFLLELIRLNDKF